MYRETPVLLLSALQSLVAMIYWWAVIQFNRRNILNSIFGEIQGSYHELLLSMATNDVKSFSDYSISTYYARDLPDRPNDYQLLEQYKILKGTPALELLTLQINKQFCSYFRSSRHPSK